MEFILQPGPVMTDVKVLLVERHGMRFSELVCCHPFYHLLSEEGGHRKPPNSLVRLVGCGSLLLCIQTTFRSMPVHAIDVL